MNILVAPFRIKIETDKKLITIVTTFQDIDYTDTISYTDDGKYEFHLNNLYNLIEYELIQHKVDEIVDLTKRVEDKLVKLISDVTSTQEEYGGGSTLWHSIAAVVIYGDVVTVGYHLDAEDIQAMNSPLSHFLSKKEIDNLVAGYFIEDTGVVFLNKDEEATIFELP